MAFAGIMLVLLGTAVIWLLGIRGLDPSQAIADVTETLGFGSPGPVVIQPVDKQGQANA